MSAVSAAAISFCILAVHSVIVVTSAAVQSPNIEEAAAQSSASVAAEVPVVHAAQTASVVVVPAVRRVTAAALATGACLPQVGAECAAQLALMTFGTVFGLVQNPAAHGVQVRSAIAVAASTSTRVTGVLAPSVPAQAVTAQHVSEPSTGPNVVPAAHPVQVASAMSVAATRRAVPPPGSVLPVQADKSESATAAPAALIQKPSDGVQQTR